MATQTGIATSKVIILVVGAGNYCEFSFVFADCVLCLIFPHHLFLKKCPYLQSQFNHLIIAWSLHILHIFWRFNIFSLFNHWDAHLHSFYCRIQYPQLIHAYSMPCFLAYFLSLCLAFNLLLHRSILQNPVFCFCATSIHASLCCLHIFPYCVEDLASSLFDPCKFVVQFSFF